MVGGPALATDADNVVGILLAVDGLDVLNRMSIQSEATDGLLRSSYDYASMPEYLGQIQRDESTRSLSLASSGGDGEPHILFTNLSNLNTHDTFSIGGVCGKGPGNLFGSVGYMNWQGEFFTDDDGEFQEDDTERTWQARVGYGWKVGDGYLGIGLSYLQGDFNGSVDNGPSRSSGEFDGKYTSVSVGYSKPISDSAGWSVRGWVNDTSVLAEERDSTTGFNARETYDLSGLGFGVKGRLNLVLRGGNAEGEVSAGYSRKDYDLDNPVTFFESFGDGDVLQDRINDDDTSRDSFHVDWRYLQRLGDRVDFAYGFGYRQTKHESELSGRESLTGEGSVGLDTASAFEVGSISIPVAGRLNITDKLRGFAGARFDYTTTEVSEFDRFASSSARSESEEKHTNTSYAVGLRYDYNEHLSAEVGMLRFSGSEGGGRDEVRGDSLSFGLNFSF
jgi:hypothetical protein